MNADEITVTADEVRTGNKVQSRISVTRVGETDEYVATMLGKFSPDSMNELAKVLAVGLEELAKQRGEDAVQELLNGIPEATHPSKLRSLVMRHVSFKERPHHFKRPKPR